MISSAGFNRGGLIVAVIDGVQMTVPNDPMNSDRQAIAAWEGVGNKIAPYVAPVPDLDAEDLAAINAALTQPGTVTRALGELVFGLMKGTITVTPSLTKVQFVGQVKAKMRNGA